MVVVMAAEASEADIDGVVSLVEKAAGTPSSAGACRAPSSGSSVTSSTSEP